MKNYQWKPEGWGNLWLKMKVFPYTLIREASEGVVLADKRETRQQCCRIWSDTFNVLASQSRDLCIISGIAGMHEKTHVCLWLGKLTGPWKLWPWAACSLLGSRVLGVKGLKTPRYSFKPWSVHYVPCVCVSCPLSLSMALFKTECHDYCCLQ